jgi:hypothetical protein
MAAVLDSIIPERIVQVEPDPQTRRRKIHCKQELIISSLQKFYGDRTETKEILEHLQGTSAMSLRLIDWFVTNYAKQYNTSYILNGQEFLVYMNYKSQLKAYSKKLFDPFCRRERILFQLPGHEPFMTTVGKLNFFRWAIEKGVLDYIKLNMGRIEREMNANQRELQKMRREAASTASSSATTVTTATTQSTKSSTRRRQRQTGEGATAKIMQKHEFDVQVTFD